MIKCNNVRFDYGSGEVLKDISLRFKKGHLYGILGPNGSGKSTLLKVLSGILKKKYGEIYINDFDIKKLSIREIAKSLSVVEQTSILEFDFTVREIIKMGLYAHNGRFSLETHQNKTMINGIINQFGLIELQDRRFNQLSGGEQQKVILARAIAQRTKIIMLDEPTNHLDINYQIEFMDLLKNYVSKGLIIIIILHDLNIASRYCDKVILLKKGEIKAFGNIEDIITKENIKLVYGIDAAVKKNIFSNSIYITPLRVKSSILLNNNKNYKKAKKIHVICGGGSGSEILSKIKHHKVSVGIVNVLDDDYILANELNYNIISEAPFSSISEESRQDLEHLIQKVDLIILTNIPVGRANLENLKCLTKTNKEIIIFEKDPIKTRDFTNGKATEIYNKIKMKSNVKVINNIEKIFDFD